MCIRDSRHCRAQLQLHAEPVGDGAVPAGGVAAVLAHRPAAVAAAAADRCGDRDGRRADPVSYTHLDVYKRQVYTSDFGGALKKLSLPIGSGVVTTPITGDETGVTQVAFGTGGAVFYVQGSPNGFGNLGTIDLGTGATSRLYSAVQPAHGLIYDPFTGLMTMFGRGETGTMSAVNGLCLLYTSRCV